MTCHKQSQDVTWSPTIIRVAPVPHAGSVLGIIQGHFLMREQLSTPRPHEPVPNQELVEILDAALKIDKGAKDGARNNIFF
jgi:hypothetical protein